LELTLNTLNSTLSTPVFFILQKSVVLEVSGTKANQIRQDHQRQGHGHTTLRAIAAQLNAQSYTTARGNQWQASSVKRIIERIETYLAYSH
jgi:hypothetical protein